MQEHPAYADDYPRVPHDPDDSIFPGEWRWIERLPAIPQFLVVVLRAIVAYMLFPAMCFGLYELLKLF